MWRKLAESRERLEKSSVEQIRNEDGKASAKQKLVEGNMEPELEWREHWQKLIWDEDW